MLRGTDSDWVNVPCLDKEIKSHDIDRVFSHQVFGNNTKLLSLQTSLKLKLKRAP